MTRGYSKRKVSKVEIDQFWSLDIFLSFSSGLSERHRTKQLLRASLIQYNETAPRRMESRGGKGTRGGVSAGVLATTVGSFRPRSRTGLQRKRSRGQGDKGKGHDKQGGGREEREEEKKRNTRFSLSELKARDAKLVWATVCLERITSFPRVKNTVFCCPCRAFISSFVMLSSLGHVPSPPPYLSPSHPLAVVGTSRGRTAATNKERDFSFGFGPKREGGHCSVWEY